MLRFLISNRRERQHFEHLSGPIEFGRGPERDGMTRCVIQDGYVSKDHVRVEEQADGQLQVENLSARNSIRLADNSIIDKGETRILRAPTRLTVGETLIDIEAVVDPIANAPLESINAPLRQPRPAPTSASAVQRAAAATQQLPVEPQQSLLELGKAPPAEKLMEWFETFIAVQRAAAGSPEFYQQTAEAVVKLVGLDRGMVILRPPRSGTGAGAARWMVQARCPVDANVMGREFSLTILDKVMKDRRTYFQSTAAPSTSESLQGVEAVVASPIFDVQDNVVGFVYGCRTRFNPQRGLGVGPLEAQVVQLLASAVATGLARLRQEAEVGRARVQFEQFFGPDLALELQRNPQLLTGQEREITVLFSDIRSFSRLSERLGPKMTCELVADVMDRLTDCVRAHEGSVVDYAGDGMMAMWNAPVDQPDHAVRGCRAALAMLAALPQLDADWHDRLGVPLKVGIGLNTGPAMVGNTGSRARFKYGPLGHTVNLASRVESATKQMGVPLLITGSTRSHIGDSFATRRLCKVRVVGIQGAVDFYELYAETASQEWLARRDAYESALSLFESGQYGSACRSVYPLLANQEGNYDVPSLNLVTRSVEAIKNPPDRFDPIWELVSK
jgi:adenylate cyclase